MKSKAIWMIIIFLLIGILALPGSAQDGPITHVVQRGENLFRISLRYGVTWDAVMKANGISDPDQIYAGQVIVIPDDTPAGQVDIPAAGPVQPAEPVQTVTHTIKAGETLASIGRLYGVTWGDVARANNITNPNSIYAGQVLSIPGASASQVVHSEPQLVQQPEPAAPEPQPADQFHTVQAGQTLAAVGRIYGLTWQQLAQYNGIADPNRIKAGQILKIPGSAAKSAGSSVYLNVPAVQQSYQMSCESASACSLLRYAGYTCESDITVFNALPKSPDNPHRGFAGSVHARPGSLPTGAASWGVGGYGVYTEPMDAALKSLGVNSQYKYFADLAFLRQLLDSGTPPLIIATYGMGRYGSAPLTFVPTDGDGGSVTIVRYEHSYAVIGYDAGGFWVIDPWTAKVHYYTNARLDADWARLGRQVLWVSP